MIKVLHKALNILEEVSKVKNGLSLSEITELIGEKLTTCSNIVQTLYKRGYLDKTKSGTYILGANAYSLTGTLSDFDTFMADSAKEYLSHLVDKTKSGAVLSVLRTGKKMTLVRVDSDSLVKVSLKAIDIADPYASSTGLLLMAYENKEELTMLPKNNRYKELIGDNEGLRALYEKARSDGYILIENTDDIFEIAVPVFCGKNVCGAIGIFAPSYKADELYRQNALETIKACANDISKILLKGEF